MEPNLLRSRYLASMLFSTHRWCAKIQSITAAGHAKSAKPRSIRRDQQQHTGQGWLSLGHCLSQCWLLWWFCAKCAIRRPIWTACCGTWPMRGCLSIPSPLTWRQSMQQPPRTGIGTGSTPLPHACSHHTHICARAYVRARVLIPKECHHILCQSFALTTAVSPCSYPRRCVAAAIRPRCPSRSPDWKSLAWRAWRRRRSALRQFEVPPRCSDVCAGHSLRQLCVARTEPSFLRSHSHCSAIAIPRCSTWAIVILFALAHRAMAAARLSWHISRQRSVLRRARHCVRIRFVRVSAAAAAAQAAPQRQGWAQRQSERAPKSVWREKTCEETRQV